VGRKLRISCKAQEKKAERVISAALYVLTDPFDSRTGVPSTWGSMVETMVLRGKFTKNGEFTTEWGDR
jgi:hypothetical protein